MAVIINDSEYEDKVVKSKGLVLVDFYADWCMPCKMLAPVIEQISEEYRDRLAVYKVNTDESQATAIGLGIMSIPTLIIYKDGIVQERISGLVDKSQIESVIQRCL